MMRMVIVANAKLLSCWFSLTLFPIFPIATEIKVKPIVVMTEPVTIEVEPGFATLEKYASYKNVI